jgi:hypothetical protein
MHNHKCGHCGYYTSGYGQHLTASHEVCLGDKAPMTRKSTARPTILVFSNRVAPSGGDSGQPVEEEPKP